MANSTPDTPDVSETKLAALKMDELRAHARKLGIDGADELHKPELLAKVKDYHYAQAHGGKHRDGSGAGSSTDGRPSASELSSMKLGELREHARKHGIDGADELHKPELPAKVKHYHYAQAHGGADRDGSGSGSPTTSHRSASELSSMKLGELREHARKLGIDGADELHKPELLTKVKDHHAADRSPSASELSSMKLGELREHAHKLGVDGADELHKPELLAKVKDHRYAQAHGGKRRPNAGGGEATGGGGGATTGGRGGKSPPPLTHTKRAAPTAV